MADDNGKGLHIDLQNEDESSHGLQVDAAALAAGKSFGAIALPIGLSFAKAAAIEAQASMALQLEGAENFAMTGNDQKISRDRTEREKETNDRLASFASVMIEQDKREREHESAWLQITHTFAGQTMGGEEWKAMSQWFRDDANIAAWEDAMMAETGQTREEVRRTGGKIKQFYDLMDKDARGVITNDERGQFETLQRDRDVRRGVEVQQEMQGLRSSFGNDQTLDSASVTDGGQNERVMSRANLNDDVVSPQGKLATVDSLSPNYQSAALGVTPTAAPVKPTPPVAANTIQISPDNMFS